MSSTNRGYDRHATEIFTKRLRRQNEKEEKRGAAAIIHGARN